MVMKLRSMHRKIRLKFHGKIMVLMLFWNVQVSLPIKLKQKLTSLQVQNVLLFQLQLLAT